MTESAENRDLSHAAPPQALRQDSDDAATSYRQDDAPTDDQSGVSRRAPNLYGDGGGARRDVDEILSVLAATPVEFARLIEGKSAEALSRPASDGGWGVIEILPHLRDWDEVYLSWIQSVLHEEVPKLENVDDSLWSIEHDYANEDIEDVCVQFGEHRNGLVNMLQNIDRSEWDRQAVHPLRGRLTLLQMADRMCDHDARHLEQARDALT